MPIQIIIYFYLFFSLLIVSKILFNYTRWVYPYIELDIPTKKDKRGIYKVAYYLVITVLLGVISGVLANLLTMQITNVSSK